MKEKSDKRYFKVPHIFIILCSIMLLVAALTYILPAGEFDRSLDPATGRELIVPGSYHTIDRNPTTIMGFLEAIPGGFVDAGWVVVLTFCVGGGFVVIRKTGVIDGAIKALVKQLSNRGIIIIPILMAVFALVDCFIGMPELCMVYVPIILPLMLALGFDSITACATALVGSAAGFTAAIANPFTVVIGQKISGLPLYSGWQFRLVVLIVVLSIGIFWVMRYAVKIRKNPKSSLVYSEDMEASHSFDLEITSNQSAMTVRQKLAGISAVILFGIMIIGVFRWSWDMPQIGAIFIAMGIVSGVVAGMSGDEICNAFMDGCQDVLMGALIVGIARGVSVIMSNASISDTVVYYLSQMVSSLPASITSVGMLLVQTLLNFLIPSGSGQAVVSMPIMAPLADMVGVTRQTAVFALQFGDGFSNILYPVSGYFMATLGLAKVPYQKWLKFMVPLFLCWSAVAAVALVIAQAINWGPF